MMSDNNESLSGYFIEHYSPLEGRDWIRSIPDYERQAFARVGFAASGYGVNGGKARAREAERDWKGRFKSNGG